MILGMDGGCNLFGSKAGKLAFPFLGAVLLVGVLAGAGCAKKTVSDVERIQASGEFRVAIVDTDSRYTSLEGETPVGIEPKLAEFIGENLGVDVVYQVRGKAEALAAVADGEADAALGCIHHSGKLTGDYLVSTSYGKGYFYVVTKTGDYALTIGALEGSPLGVDRGLDEDTKSSLYKAEGVRIADYDSPENGAEDVKNGVIRAYICYEDQAKQFLEDEALQVQNMANLEPEEFVIVTGKENSALVSGMNTLIRQFLDGSGQ